MSRELDACHPRHVDVGEREIHGAIGQEAQRLHAACRLAHHFVGHFLGAIR